MNDYIEHKIYELVEKLSPGDKISEAIQLLIIMAVAEGKMTISDTIEFFNDYLVITKAE